VSWRRFAVPIAGCAVLVTACIPIPVPNVKPIPGAQDAHRIVAGENARADVVAVFGEPNVAADDRVLVYNWEKSEALMLGPDPPGAGHTGFRVIVELDSQGRVTRVLSRRSEDEPKPPEEKGEIIACGPRTAPRAVAVTPDGASITVLLRGELCFAAASGSSAPVKVPTLQDPKHLPYGIFDARLAYSPDGRILALIEPARPLVLLVTATAQPLRTLGDLDAPPQTWSHLPRVLAFSPDGTRVASTESNGDVVIWEVATGVERLRHRTPAQAGTIAFSPDGEFLAVGWSGGGFEVVDAGGHVVGSRAAVADSPSVTALAFSPDGRWLAVGTAVHLELWDAREVRGERGSAARRTAFLLPFFRHAPAYNVYDRPVVAFSHDSRTLAAFAHETITLVDVESATVRVERRLDAPMRWVAFDPEWRTLAMLGGYGVYRGEVRDRQAD